MINNTEYDDDRIKAACLKFIARHGLITIATKDDGYIWCRDKTTKEYVVVFIGAYQVSDKVFTKLIKVHDPKDGMKLKDNNERFKSSFETAFNSDFQIEFESAKEIIKKKMIELNIKKARWDTCFLIANSREGGLVQYGTDRGSFLITIEGMEENNVTA